MKLYKNIVSMSFFIIFLVWMISFAGITVYEPVSITAINGGLSGETTLTFSTFGNPTEYRYEISNASKPAPYDDADISGLDIITSGCNVVIDEGQYVHVYSIESGLISGYGEHLMLIGEIGQPIDLNVQCAPDPSEIGNTLVSIDVLAASNYVYKETSGSITEQYASTAIPAGTDSFTTGDSLSLTANNYVHVWSSGANGKINGYGEFQVLEQHISDEAGTMDITAVKGDTPGTTVLTLSNAPGTPDNYRYVISDNSGYSPTNILPETTGMDLLIPGVTEISVLADKYIQVYSHENGLVTGFGEHQIVGDEIMEYPPLTANFSVADGQYGIENDYNLVITFSEVIRMLDDSPMDASNFQEEVSLKENDASGNPVSVTVTMNGECDEFTLDPMASLVTGQKYCLEVTNQMESINGGAYNGDSLSFTVGDDFDIRIDENDDYKFKYTGQYDGNYYVMMLPSISAYPRPVTSSDVVLEVDDQLDTGDPINFSAFRIETSADDLSYEIDSYVSPSTNYDVYIAFKDTIPFVFSKMEYSNFTTANFTPFITQISCLDDDASNDKTVVFLPTADGGNTFAYKVSSDDNPVARPALDTVISDWTPITDGSAITVENGRYINVAEIDGSNQVKKYGSVLAVTEIEDPYNRSGDFTVVSDFIGQTTLQISYDLLSGSESKIYYSIHNMSEVLSNITNDDVKNGCCNALDNGYFYGNTTGGASEIVSVFANEDITLGDYQIAYATEVLDVNEFYGTPIVETINNGAFEMTIQATGSDEILPGSGVNGAEAILTQVISSNASTFTYTTVSSDNVESDLKVLFIEQSYIYDKLQYEIRDLLKNDLSTIISDGEAVEFPYNILDTSQNVMAVDPGLYVALLYNANSSNSETYGDYSLISEFNAFYRVPDGNVSVTVHPIYDGDGGLAVFEFDNITEPGGILSFFDNSSGEAVYYDGSFYNTPSSEMLTWYTDPVEFKTYVCAVYSENIMSLMNGKTMAFNLNPSGIAPLNGDSLVNTNVSTQVVSIFDNFAFGNYLKTQSISVQNSNPYDVTYVLFDSTLTGSVPARLDIMSTFVADYPGQALEVTVNEDSTGSIDLSSLNYGTYHVLAYPDNYINMSYMSPVSTSTIVVYQQQSSGNSSSSNNDDDDEPDPEPTILDILNESNDVVQNATDDETVNNGLESFNDILEQIEDADDAEQSMDIIGDTIGNAGEDVENLEQEDKEELVDNITDIIGNTEELIEKVGEDTDKVELVEKIIESTKDVIDELVKVQDVVEDQILVTQLNNSLVDLANKVIEEESKISVDDKKLVTIEDLLKPIEKDKEIKEKMEKILEDFGVDQELKELKTSIVIDVEESINGESQEIGFSEDAIEQLSKEVESVQINFGKTSIQVDSDTLDRVKDDMHFTTEDLDSIPGIKPDEHEDEYFNVRHLEAYEGDNKIEEFAKPVRVSFDIKEFGFDTSDEEELSSLLVMVLNEETGEWEPTGGVYDPVTNEISFYRIHMSKYTVVKNRKTYSDVNNSWAKDEINNLLGKGVTDATEQFKPGEFITREEFVAWICRAYGLQGSGHEENFDDIEESNPYYNEIANACNQGLIYGRTENEFAPKDTVTREEMATLIAHVISKYNEIKVPNDGEKRLAGIKDGTTISDWAVDNVALVIDMGIMETDCDGNFNPQKPITKEAAAGIFSKVYK